ncbi:MAG: urease accessory protein UreF [Alphaproteobacteria bacterium]|nr:urease accessory protein UreF [Alphaproteobacteria bacterium]
MTIDPGALYRLMAWLSPAYPVGGFSYSHGLEFAVEHGLVKDRIGLVDWIGWILERGAGHADGVLFARAHEAASIEDWAELDAIADLAQALRGSAETALESRQQGEAFLSVTRRAWPDAVLESWTQRRGENETALCVAVALAAATAGIPVAAALGAYLQAFAANLVSAGVRLIPLGQTDGQLALAELAETVAETARHALSCPLDRLGTAAAGVDWTSMRHETQYTRLFRS